MLDVFNIPKSTGTSDIKTFIGNSVAAGVTWSTWTKPRGKTMAFIFIVGAGGAGGNGVIGANSVAAGGGGGGSAGQSRIIIPLALLPDTLYISTGIGSTGAGIASYVSVAPNVTTNHLILHAAGGGLGGNAAAGTGGAAGAAGTISTIAIAPLGGLGDPVYLVGQAGIIGGAAIAGAALTLPVTGLVVTGGTGGGGLPAAAAAGTNGGSFTTPAAPSAFPVHLGGVGSATATLPADAGRSGFDGFGKLFYSYGGTGGASTHGTATGGGLVQSAGGRGGYGSGGGGTGGALTGSSAGVPGRGGNGFCMIITW